ncbi:gluconolactonase [Acidovorax sp. SRB_14]|uniref:SMP-30/gluconolactonase/LRE family protein n=1 Tax=Acidovorax sp. SRB_14 TaxID=1962699 RepID=UPI00156794BF|nr:SMP-30/gluconolactonase/LRE family protein [Acidovorax sp. SRB_14]NMM81466.1 gluconolactonase [Acidovorax sp. SRB_14]
MAWNVVGSEVCELGESPFWQAGEQRLYWVDIAGRAALRADPATGATERWPLPAEPGCMAPARTAGQASGWVLALRDGIYRAPHWGGALHRIARLPYDPAHERANDGKCDPFGRFWVGTRDERPGGGHAAMYCIDARHGPAQVQTLWGGASTLNGLGWSPDQRTLYSADTPTHRIEARDWDGERNALGPARTLHQFAPKSVNWQPGTAGYGGRPDGAAVDVQGNYWCAMYEGARVLQLSPAGAVLQSIATPVACPTMVCLGGPEGRTMFVTTARQGRPEDELARTPLAGRVLALAQPVDVPGLPVQAFEDAAAAAQEPV